ncbi:MAG: VanW family protein [Propionibacteriaceae bacterium]|nr:VanW family protein [Propionibacteriaceae bacterium]
MTEKKSGSARKWLIGGGVGLVVLLAGGYVAAHFAAGDKVPSNAVVAGVSIGGLAPAEAETKLRSALSERYSAPISLTDDAGNEATIEPAASGLSVDWSASVTEAGGGASWNPVDIAKTLFGGGESQLVITVDEQALRTQLESNAGVFQVEGVDATLGFEGGRIVRTESTDATVLDVAASVEAVAGAFKQGQQAATVTVVREAPAVTTAMVDQAVTEFAEPAISGPVPVAVGSHGTFNVTPEHIAGATTFAVEGDKLVPHLDPRKLFELTSEARAELGLQVGKNASYTMSGGSIQVVPSEDGQQVDVEGLAAGVLAAATKSGDARSASVEVVQGPAEFATEDAERLKPTQVIGEFTTRYPHAPYRNTNIGRAAELVNGTVLMPGETFSLNGRLGERTAANGFTEGYMIKDGVLVKDLGGGVSQAATTLYNAGFFAGYEDVEHKPHSLYFDRYPVGREATVVYGALDMSFKNNTEYPAYIEGFIEPSSSGNKGSVTFRIHSIPTWDKVESTEPVKSDYYYGRERVLDTPDCKPQSPIKGFTATWQRLFHKDGAVAKTENYTWKYSAGDKITCAPKTPAPGEN